jgi:hypothetical protein
VLGLFILPAPKPSQRAIELASFGLGSALCLSWLQSIAGYERSLAPVWC